MVDGLGGGRGSTEFGGQPSLGGEPESDRAEEDPRNLAGLS